MIPCDVLHLDGLERHLQYPWIFVAVCQGGTPGLFIKGLPWSCLRVQLVGAAEFRSQAVGRRAHAESASSGASAHCVLSHGIVVSETHA